MWNVRYCSYDSQSKKKLFACFYVERTLFTDSVSNSDYMLILSNVWMISEQYVGRDVKRNGSDLIYSTISEVSVGTEEYHEKWKN
jgi:hypothetical protein